VCTAGMRGKKFACIQPVTARYGRPSLMPPAAPGSLATPPSAASAAAPPTPGHAVPTRIAEASIVGGQLVPVLSGQVVEVVHDFAVAQGQLASQPLGAFQTRAKIGRA